jgi:hypothetical protein
MCDTIIELLTRAKVPWERERWVSLQRSKRLM